jgi:hypothetical protein
MADGELLIPQGDCLGEMKKELPGRRIVEFGAAAAKFYYEVHVDAATGGDKQTETMCRGVTQHHKASQLLTCQRVKEMIFSHYDLHGTMYILHFVLFIIAT